MSHPTSPNRPNKHRPFVLPLIVFCTGACVLIIEIVAIRLLSPFYGNTLFTVSSVLGIVLAALSGGYYIGGILADRNPSDRIFYAIILGSGICVFAIHLLSLWLLPHYGSGFSIFSGPLFFSFVLFFVPALLLGMLSPFAIKLQCHHFPDRGVGSISGAIFFWSTLGSITGSIAAGFVLIPRLGTDTILLSIGLFLGLLGWIPLLWQSQLTKRALTLTLCLLVVFPLINGQLVRGHPYAIHHEEGIYSGISVLEGTLNDRPVRILAQGKGGWGGIYLDAASERDLPLSYMEYFQLYELLDRPLERALFLGGGAFTMPQALLDAHPTVKVDVAEIEPRLFAIAQEYFNVEPSSRLHTHLVDGRHFLLQAQQRYDYIFCDVYKSLYYIPSHFTTREFFELAHRQLNDGGIFLANLIGRLSAEKPSFLLSELKTFQSVFPQCALFAVENAHHPGLQNFILVGWKSSAPLNFDALFSQQKRRSFFQKLPLRRVELTGLDLRPHAIYTDRYCPVDFAIGAELQRQQGNPLPSNKIIISPHKSNSRHE